MSRKEQKVHDEVLKRIEQSRREQDWRLDLDGFGLTTLPSEIGQLTALTQLSLANNQLTTLPSGIGQLTALTELSLDNNQLTTLPSEIGQLTVLTQLWLVSNQLTTLPSEIGQLTALTLLWLDNNQLTTLPSEIWQLTALRELSLVSNQLTTLPSEIGQLTALTLLWLRNNQLTTLPSEIGQLTALTELSLSNNQLTTLPSEIGQLTALRELSLSNNQLTTLPSEIGQLTALRELSLANNQLTTLPSEIGQLTALRELSLANNQLTTLPSEILQLTALTELSLDNNQLTTLPSEIGQFTALRELSLDNNQLTTLPSEIGQLTALRELSLANNQLTTLPSEIGQFTALTQLSLDNNQLTTLPSEIGQLTALTLLWLRNNQLTTLPSEIGQLTALTLLWLANNQLTTLPSEIGQLTVLTELSLDNNELTTLPSEIGQLTALRVLFLHSNPALGIPDSVLGPSVVDIYARDEEARKQPARPADIFNFYFAQQRGAEAGTLRAVNEIKVMLVGRGGAGKTSLRRFFLGQPHNRKEPETPGIALDTFPLRCGEREITVRLWDFAGQEITHALHQFFLTEGCVYLLVLDPRSNTEMRDAEYWLGLLQRYARGAPVVIVLNRQDARQGGYDVDRRMLRERFPFIREFISTNCESRMGCDDLRQALHGAIEDLKETEPPHLKVPEPWLRVMQECFQEARGGRRDEKSKRRSRQVGHATAPPDGRQHLTLDEFREICCRHGEMEPEKQESLARLLHRLGAVLHFVDEPRLRDTTVLSPHWLTDGVYRLLRHKDRPGSDGTLTLAEALKALPGETEETLRFLLRLMERFEMCFPVEGEEVVTLPTKWLIPGALNPFQPKEVDSEWQKPGSVRMRYVYDPLPEGVLPRFIVLTHLLSEGKPRWRNGVVLAEGDAAALVRRGEKPNYVEVIAFGPERDRLRLLEIVQGNLERINADVPDPKPFAELELAGLPGVFRRVADLEAAELARQQVAVDVESAGKKALVQPTPQLNLTSEQEARNPERVPLRAFLSYSHDDKRVKGIFQQNLTVMMKKKFITTWHDGLIESGMRWREEIEENLEKMDIFVGLLTTAFLASDFIGEVEIKAARERLRQQERDFVFVLVLVDDISLQELDLAEYQILKPGGRPVSAHKSRKDGFNEVQKELETLIAKQQSRKKQRKLTEPVVERLMTRAAIQQEGVTIIVEGDYIARDKTMKDDHSTHIGGDVTNSQVGQTLTNCTNMIQQQAPGERRDLLEELEREVKNLIDQLPAAKQEDAPQVAENLEMLVKQATAAKPNRKWYDVSAAGLLDASKWVKDFSGNIAGTIGDLGKLI